MTKATGRYNPPSPTAGDAALTVVRATLSAIPMAGGSLVEVMNYVCVPPLQKRQKEWMESVACGLLALEDAAADFHIENLQKNDAFISTVVGATRVAVTTHRSEKLDALRNAVLNVAIQNNSDNSDAAEVFLALIDVLAAVHISVLSSLDEYRCILRNSSFNKVEVERFVSRKRQSGEGLVILHGLVDLGYSQLTHDSVLKQLMSHGLICRVVYDGEKIDYERPVSVLTSVSDIGITAMGRKFLEFIKSPLPEHTAPQASNGRSDAPAATSGRI